MKRNPNKMPVELYKEGAFGGTYFGGIYSSLNGKWYKKLWKEFDQLKNLAQKIYCSDYCDISVDIYCVKRRSLLRFCENKGQINEIDLYGWFQRYFS